MLIKGYGGSPQRNKVTILDNIDIYSFVTNFFLLGKCSILMVRWTSCGHQVDIHRTLGGNPAVIQWKFGGHPVVIQQKSGRR